MLHVIHAPVGVPYDFGACALAHTWGPGGNSQRLYPPRHRHPQWAGCGAQPQRVAVGYLGTWGTGDSGVLGGVGVLGALGLLGGSTPVTRTGHTGGNGVARGTGA